VASQFGDKCFYDDTETVEAGQIPLKGRAKFAEMECAGSNAKFLKALLGTKSISLPYILIYRGSSGLIKSFECAPKNIQILVNAVNELAEPVAEIRGGNWGLNGFEEQSTNPLPDSPRGWNVLPNSLDSQRKGLGVTQLYLSTLSATR
jgi:hypothetical protein